MRYLIPVFTVFAVQSFQMRELGQRNVDFKNQVTRGSSKVKLVLNTIDRTLIHAKMTTSLALVASLTWTTPNNAVAAPELFQPSRLAGSDVYRPLPNEEPFLWSDKAISSQDRAKLNELNRLRKLEDERLDKCRDQGVYWESCFVYGIGGRNTVKEMGMNDELSSMRQRPPTW